MLNSPVGSAWATFFYGVTSFIQPRLQDNDANKEPNLTRV